MCVHMLQRLHVGCWWELCVWLKIGASTGQTKGLTQADEPEGSVIFFIITSTIFQFVYVPSLVNICIYKPEKKKGSWLSVYVLCEFCWRQSLTAAGFVTCCITVLSLRVSVFPWDMCSALLPVEPANEKAAAASPSLGRDPGSLDTGFGPRGQADVVQEQSSWRNKPHSSSQLIDRDGGDLSFCHALLCFGVFN